MKKFINIFVSVVAMATNIFAQDDTYSGGQIDKNSLAAHYSKSAHRKLIDNVAGQLFGEDCADCLFPASQQRKAIVKILNIYKQKAKWGETITESNLPQILNESEIIWGSDMSGLMWVYKANQDGYGYTVEKTYPKALDKFIAYKGLPYIKVEGRPSNPETSIVMSDMAPPPPPPVTAKPEPTPKQEPPTVEKKPEEKPSVKTESGTTVINIYNNGQPNANGYYGAGYGYGWSDPYYRPQPSSYGPNGTYIGTGNCNNYSYEGGYGYGGGHVSLFGGWRW